MEVEMYDGKAQQNTRKHRVAPISRQKHFNLDFIFLPLSLRDAVCLINDKLIST